MTTPHMASISLLSLLFVSSHLRLTLGFAPKSSHRFNSVSVSNKQHQLASQRSDDERQSRPAPFFMENVEEEQQQQQDMSNGSWNTVQQSNGYTQQQMQEDYSGDYSETAPVNNNNGQYQNQQDYYYQESSQPQATAQEQQQQPSAEPNYSSPQDDGGISNVDARVLESILADGKLDLNSEEEVKKLLEGPRQTEEFYAPSNDSEEEESGKYSSKVISVSSSFLCVQFSLLHVQSYVISYTVKSTINPLLHSLPVCLRQ